MRLRHTRPTDPGFTRRRHGKGFRYLDTEGRPLRDPAHLERIKGLVIPPAWRDVWICPLPNGHLQAVGTDAAGRRQYLYHPRFRAEQERAKHEHVLEVAEVLPRLRERTAVELTGRGLRRERVLATGASLLDLGFFRIGGDRYANENGSYGLTTLLREHVGIRRGVVTFNYPAKHGQWQEQAVAAPEILRSVIALKRRRSGGDRLFAYWDRPAWRNVSGEEVNAYLREAGEGVELTAKDFRTWHATVLAAVALAVSQPVARTETARRRAIGRAVREVAAHLGNTPAVCRASYINPAVIELYEEGVTVAGALEDLGRGVGEGLPATRGPIERAVLEMLRTSRPPGPARP
ncbi:DNA topoisomerase IB [Streptomyces calidiresistens]